MDSLFHGQSIGYPHDLGNPQMAKKCFFFPVQTPHCQDGAHLFGAKDVDYNPNATRQRNELRWEGEDFSEEPKSMRTVMEHLVKSWKNIWNRMFLGKISWWMMMN